MSVVVSFARALTRFEIAILSIIYIYFVVSDNVPLVAFVLIVLAWVARAWIAGAVTIATPLDLPILLILLWLPLSLWVSTNWWLSLPKIYGVILGAAFFYAIVNRVSTPNDLSRAAFWLALLCVAIALAGLLGTDWVQGRVASATFIYERLPRFIQGIPRSIAGGFARNGVGGTLTFTIPLLAALFFARDARAWAHRRVRPYMKWFPYIITVGLTLSIITLALTQSRGAILGSAIGLLALAIWIANPAIPRRKERRFAWVAAIILIGAIVLVAAGQVADLATQSGGSALAEFLLRLDARDGTLASRMEVWQRGLMMIQDFPVTGIGIGTYDPMAHSLYPFFIAAPGEPIPHAHNNLLQVAVDLGIPGLVAYSALLTGFALCAVRAYRALASDGARALIAGLSFGMLAHQIFGLTDAFILGSKPGLLMWIFMALAVACYVRREEWSKEDE